MSHYLFTLHSGDVFNYLIVYQGKLKADQSRQKVEEQIERAAHNQRSEAAQQRKEEKKRAEKERIMKEDDPDKQRRLEVLSFLSMFLRNVIVI